MVEVAGGELQNCSPVFPGGLGDFSQDPRALPEAFGRTIAKTKEKAELIIAISGGEQFDARKTMENNVLHTY